MRQAPSERRPLTWSAMAMLLLLLPVLLLLRPAAAHACECGYPPDAQEALDEASAVFKGRVIDIAKQPRRDEGYDAVILEVERAWKGVETTQVIVYTAWTNCRFPFQDDMSYLLYAAKDGDNLVVRDCSRSAAAESPRAMEDIAAFGEGQTPTIEVDLRSRFSQWQPILTWGSAIGGLLLVLLGGWMLVRRLARLR
ncbi:hypothetical protein PA598K_00346 [Paenibacillus sp. 598K]|uniref:hypothetical protein n=1 Tax=Paenibacillus sp. 598K TaxID=1117987 RepID=UPI000FF9CB16|nr:hypothetical protein [Paenibacillus sp. 598K]GBF72110.1 hypothetical protein PA598K_00346 [Paenibacillus sp. 598K]